MGNKPTGAQDSRHKLVAGAADMIRRRGLNATSVRELAKFAHAPLGSTYHHFPGGKTQLATEAVAFAGDLTSALLVRELEKGPIDGLHAFLRMWRKIVVDTDFRAGCPVLAVAVEDLPDADSAPREAAATAFTQWTDLLAGALHDHGAEPARAARTATLIVAAVEGSVAMCRATQSIEPLDRIAEELEFLIRSALTHP
ncbi:TetR/AcrR family transcriptional regulator [Nocardia crassostreae]|uniref:TetR/AcrR family transcriptional regulator n=1 Tax=Nocardia crassostreae TaxID=53428 RepID=UPI000AAC2809|nr:helix-turn-helix domain-containing protein [Nocardia crassostreae]